MDNMAKDGAKPDVYRRIRVAGMLSLIPFILVSGPLAGYFVGEFLEKRFDLPSYALYILMIVGFAGSVQETVRIIRLTLKSEGK